MFRPKRPPEQLPVKCEGLFAERAGESWKDLARQRSSMHGVNPLRLQPLHTIDDTADRILMRENAGLAVQFAHCRTEILANDRWLIAWLNEEIGRKETSRFLLP